MTTVSMRPCDNLSLHDKTSINFGDTEKGDICGKVESEGDSIDKKEVYTQLFKDQGSLRSLNGKGGISGTQWMQQCGVGGEGFNQGVIFDQDSESSTQHLGLCEETEIEQINFVKKESKNIGNSELLTMSICKSNCGNSSESDAGFLEMSPKVLQQEQAGSGKEVKFYR